MVIIGTVQSGVETLIDDFISLTFEQYFVHREQYDGELVSALWEVVVKPVPEMCFAI